MKEKGTIVKCTRCGYLWEYKGDRKTSEDIPQWICCPRCRKNIVFKEEKDE